MLEDAQKAAQEIVTASKSMAVVLGSYSDGKLDKKKFQKWFRSLADKIDDSTDPIVRINMIDPSFRDDPETYQEVSSKDAFVSLIDEMEKLSLQLQKRVMNLTGGTGTSVEDLQAPSLTALTESVKRLSKVLEKSVKKI